MLLLLFHVGHPKPLVRRFLQLPGSGASKQMWVQNCLLEVNSSWGKQVTFIFFFFIRNGAEIPSCFNTSVATRSMAVSVDGAAKTGPEVRRWGRTGVHHVPCGNQKRHRSGVATAELVSRFAPCDAGESHSLCKIVGGRGRWCLARELLYIDQSTSKGVACSYAPWHSCVRRRSWGGLSRGGTGTDTTSPALAAMGWL